MGKVKKVVTKVEGGQQTISGFFMKSSVPVAAEKQSGLFSRVGGASNKSQTSSSKSGSSTCNNSAISNSSVKGSEKLKCEKSSVNTIIIPESQCEISPSTTKDRTTILAESCKDNVQWVNDDEDDEAVIIPITPDSKPDKGKRQYKRSFLLGASSIYSNPIQKAKENREAKLKLKKQASIARKSLISVSVDFNNTSSHFVQATEVQKNTKPPNVEKSDNLHLLPPGSTSDLVVASNAAQNDEVIGQFPVDDNETPTKMYKENASIKRMAKAGTSPDAKRNLSYDSELSDTCISIADGKDLAGCSSEFVSAKSLGETVIRKTMQSPPDGGCNKKKPVKPSLSHTSMLSYQLLGDSKCKKGGTNKSVTASNISVADDEMLGDILDELNTSFDKSQISKGQPGKMSMCKTGKSGKAAPMIAQLQSPETGKSKVEKNQVQDFMDVEWTKDDESFFSHLGIDKVTNCDAGNKEVKSSSCTTSVAKNIFKTATSVKLNGPTDSNKGRKNGSNGSQNETKPVEGICREQENKNFETKIEVYPTQVQATRSERPETPDQDELAINDFYSQLDSQELCDEFEHLSPFKKQPCTSLPDLEMFQSEPACKQFGRYTVTNVDRRTNDIVLDLLEDEDSSKTCVLQGFWCDTHIDVGDVVHILAKFTDNVCYISDSTGQVVVNPDLLLSGTTIVSSVFCMRRSVLKEKFKGVETGNVHMLYGNIIHSLFQQVLRKKIHDKAVMIQEAKDILKQSKMLLDMYDNEVGEERVMDEIKNYLPQLQSWVQQHTNIGQDVIGQQRKTTPDILVTKVKDIEENIWSPRFGVKGKIDLTIEVKQKGEKKPCVLPLELKTGKPSYSVEHKGQVTLYSMMSSDRRDDPGKGLLLYLKEPSMKVIPAEKANQNGLLQRRNEMAYFLSRQVHKTEEDNQATFSLGRLPDPISNLRACQKCPQLVNCAIYQRDVERSVFEGDGRFSLVSDTLSHLTSQHVSYFTHWCLLLDLEVKVDAVKKTLAGIWCKTSQQRETEGECLGGMVLADNLDRVFAGDSDSVVISLVRHHQYPRKQALTRCGLNESDNTVISCEKPSWIAVCTGFVKSVTASHVDILVDRDAVERLVSLKGRTFRIDRCNVFSTAGIFYTNISKLMSPTEHHAKLRRLIIDQEKPQSLNTLSKGNIEKVKKVLKLLNKPQKTSILKVLMCRDYQLIRGFPGTGKTSTIVALIKVLEMLGKSVLLTSYTHSAVDNVLLKLKKDGVKFLRLGRLAKINSEVQDFSFEKLTREIKTTADMQKFIHSQKIVATSCLGTNHPIFNHQMFDVCIVDEASQVLQPACLGPIFSAKCFVLVGDPKQLPPVVQSKEARELGMDESLFQRLENCGATYDLNLQYRMNSCIMDVSNTLVYAGCLQCGSTDVANRTMTLAVDPQQISDQPTWMTDVLDTSLEKSVVFLDTSKVGASESKDKTGGYQNVMEAEIVCNIVSIFIQCGIKENDIGVIAPYRSQVNFLRSKVTSKGKGQVEVNTVDQYQGRDKEIIIISFVRSSTESKKKGGELLSDERRLNVAVTRAKTKLVLVGNTDSLKNYLPLQNLIDLASKKEQITLMKSIR